MFYVVNHITSLNGLIEYFKNIYSHLKPGGIFIFDCFNSIAFNRDAPKVLKKESYTITPIIDYFTSKMELIGENTKSPELNYKIEQRIWGIDLILEIINNLNFVNTQIFKQNTYTLVSPDDYKISIVCQK
jgi:SAM-dependent methyltransferase